MATFVVKVLSVTLGLFFIFVGLLKLTPSVNQDLYKEMRKQYIRMAKVFPLANQTGWKPNAHTYRKVVASTEVTCGTILTFVPGPLKIGANVLMIALMVNDVIAHTQIKDGLQRMSLPLVFILLLTCRLIIHYQEKKRLQKLQEETEQLAAKAAAAATAASTAAAKGTTDGAHKQPVEQTEDKKHK